MDGDLPLGKGVTAAEARARDPPRAVDAIFRQLPVVALPGYSRPLIKVRDHRELIEQRTYDGRTRVR